MLIIAYILVISGCRQQLNLYNEVPTISSPEKLEYTIKPFQLDAGINDTFKFKWYSILHKNDEDFIFIHNLVKDRFQIYNLSSNTKIYEQPRLNYIAGSENFDEINSVYFHDFDSIFIAQEYLITLMDTSKVLSSISINDPTGKSKLHYRNYDHAPIYYDPIDTSIQIETKCIKCYQHSKKFYENPVESAINLNDLSVSNFPIFYSKLYLNNYYGFNNHVHRSIKERTSIYSFSMDSNIYVFNKNDSSINIFGGKSQYQNSSVQPLLKKNKYSTDLKFEHLTTNPYYNKVIFDKFRGYYYRFFSKEIPLKNSDGTYNSWGDKELVLMIFDTEFNLLKEINFGQHKYNPYRSFVAKEGLFLFIVGKGNEALKFNILTLKE